jgi:Fe-Mn family superoxide dismutase
MKYELPKLDFAYNALEPHIDQETMIIHHTMHHQKYIDNFNAAVENSELEGKAPERIFPFISTVPDAIARNAGQTFNHSFFWKSLIPNGITAPAGAIAEAINSQFGSFNEFKERFADMAAAQFGSGWAWLIRENKKLDMASTPNHINPLMDISEMKGKPLFCLDVWEHAYYLKYKNRRVDFIDAFWNVLNWEEVNRLYLES